MSVFSSIKPRNKAERNAFDLSRRSVFSTKVGQILPVFVQPTLPSSVYKIDLQQLMRTQPLQTAAFSGFSINYDFVFVPYNHLYSSFNQFIAQRENKNLVNQPNYTNVPHFNLSSFLRWLTPYVIYDYFNTQVTPDEYFSESLALNNTPYVWMYDEHSPFVSQALQIVRNLDMLGYGNLLPFFKEAARLIVLEFFTGDEYSFRSWRNWFNSLAEGSVTTFEEFEYAVGTFLFQDAATIYGFYGDDYFRNLGSPTLWPVLAYNKCFYEYYRNSYYDLNYRFHWREFNTSLPYVKLFNLDDVDGEMLANNPQESVYARIGAIFSVKPHLYKRDLFTGVLPSTQFGDVSLMVTDDNFRSIIYEKLDGSSSNVYAASTSSSSSVGALYVTRGNNLPADTDAKFKLDPALAISVLESRRADAMQRFRERMMRAGDKTKDVFVAHGWSKPKSESSFEPVFLGSFDGRLDINVVASTTQNESVDLGQLAANGVSAVSGNEITVHSSDFGVILGLMYIVKDAEYDAYGLENHLTLTEPFDFPYPELQNISLAPVTKRTLNNYGAIPVQVYSDENQNAVIGYLPRYMEYKTAVDKVHGEFFTASPFTAQPPVSLPIDYKRYMLPITLGVFSNWVTPRSKLYDATYLYFLYQQSDCADNVFTVLANSCQDTDQFLVNLFVKCYAVEPLSVIGLPI